MRRSRVSDCIIAAMIGMIATGITIYIIWAAAFVLKVLAGMLG